MLFHLRTYSTFYKFDKKQNNYPLEHDYGCIIGIGCINFFCSYLVFFNSSDFHSQDKSLLRQRYRRINKSTNNRRRSGQLRRRSGQLDQDLRSSDYKIYMQNIKSVFLSKSPWAHSGPHTMARAPSITSEKHRSRSPLIRFCVLLNH